MLEKFPLFSSLPQEHLASLEAIAREIPAKKGSILFSPGDEAQGFFAVLNGSIRVYRGSAKGKEITLEIVGAGSTFAEASLFTDTYHCYAEVLKDSTVFLIRKDAFLEMIQTNIQFAATWIHILSLEVIHLRHRVEEYGSDCVASRRRCDKDRRRGGVINLIRRIYGNNHFR